VKVNETAKAELPNRNRNKNSFFSHFSNPRFFRNRGQTENGLNVNY
jgi:hypothetical protein